MLMSIRTNTLTTPTEMHMLTFGLYRYIYMVNTYEGIWGGKNEKKTKESKKGENRMVEGKKKRLERNDSLV